MERIVLFDGECNFCDKSVQFIIKRDPKGLFKFSSKQSDLGKDLLYKYNVPQELDSLILIEGDKFYDQSTAALRICCNLSGGWKLFYIFVFVPKTIRNQLYNFFSSNRYKWFGKKNDVCSLPSPEIRKRFL
ncbi:thiol-disulfide oxidoreductase DCC family protein [Halobacillus litoralis]|uniref:thiol-disulfide oxidoreductase DCC family protein n=1 Tax=Halobacillus litoralis TaxID=45668 RepID=UPI001CFE50C2|nr:DCC1-like thiol-disulfide oxidoreductase family protein [Halobacillus litoralis]